MTTNPSLPTQADRENLFWIDVLRVVVMFGVIVIHVTADVITEWGAVSKSWWWAANIYDSLVRGCVPLFVMISGALLFSKSESIGDFFKKRFHRIAIPFIVWNILYLLWRKHFREPGLGFGEALGRVASSDVHFHLWFLYIIVGLYLITPVFRIFVAHASRREIFYFLVLWFCVTSLFPFAEQFTRILTGVSFHIKIPVEPAEGFIGYFVLGYFLKEFSTEKWKSSALVVWIVSFFVSVGGTWFLAEQSHRYQGIFYDNLAPNVVFYVAAFFLLAKFVVPAFEIQFSPRGENLVLSLSKASFGIYLIHPMILEALAVGRWGIVLKANLPHPVYIIPLTVFAIYVLSFGVIFVIQKIPYLKNIV